MTENNNILKKFRDAHYFQISSQGNVYTLTNLQLANGTNKILAASLKREVYCFEYPENFSDLLIPQTKEVLFTYIPGMVEIISIDAFNKSKVENDFVIGITITKVSTEQQTRENYLNIYSAWESSQDFNLDSISQNCLNVELSFIPYKLYHTNLFCWESNTIAKDEIVWLLSGSDEKIHLYKEYSTNHCYKEVELKEYFPEFANTPGIVMWMDVCYFDNNNKRFSAYGCECGYIFLSIIDNKTLEIIESYTAQFENTIASIKIFSDRPQIKNSLDNISKQTRTNNYHLLVTNTTLPSVVFINLLENGLSEMQILEDSDEFNVTSCACIADIDFDGRNEIVLGKYGEELLAYKYNEQDGWQMEGIKSFPNPIYSVLYEDVTGDGIKELIVLTLKGVHIIQHDPDDIQHTLETKIKKLKLLESET